MPINLAAPLASADPEIAAQIRNEVIRQHEGLEMIASENFVSEAVLEAYRAYGLRAVFVLRLATRSVVCFERAALRRRVDTCD